MHPDRAKLPRVARALILLGVAAWPVMGLVWLLRGEKPPVPPFLTWHLGGILPGVTLKLYGLQRGRSPPGEGES